MYSAKVIKSKKIMFLTIFLTLICIVNCLAQNDTLQVCKTPTYDEIYTAMLKKNFFELSSYIESFGGKLISHQEKPYYDQSVKYPLRKTDSILLCEKNKNYYYVIEQDGGFSLSLSVKLTVDKIEYERMFNSVHDYRKLLFGYIFIIFGFYDDTPEYNGFKVTFLKDNNGGGEISYWYFRGW